MDDRDSTTASVATAGAMAIEEATCAACAAASTVSKEASFGIEEGEADQLEKKWITW